MIQWWMVLQCYMQDSFSAKQAAKIGIFSAKRKLQTDFKKPEMISQTKPYYIYTAIPPLYGSINKWMDCGCSDNDPMVLQCYAGLIFSHTKEETVDWFLFKCWGGIKNSRSRDFGQNDTMYGLYFTLLFLGSCLIFMYADNSQFSNISFYLSEGGWISWSRMMKRSY